MEVDEYETVPYGEWLLDDDETWIVTIAEQAMERAGVLIYGAPGADQEELGRRVATRLAGSSGILDVCPDGKILDTLDDVPAQQGAVFLLPRIELLSVELLERVSRHAVKSDARIVAVSSGDSVPKLSATARLLGVEITRVRELTEEAGFRYLKQGLGGPLSDRAAYAIWAAAGGNRARMRSISEDWQELHYLQQDSGVWVIRSHKSPAGPRLTAFWRDLLDNIDIHTRDVFEYLACAGKLPLSMLIGLCGPHAVDLAHEMGHLTIAEDRLRATSLRGVVNARAIKAQVPPGRSRELLDTVTTYIGEHGLTRPAGLVHWESSCGLEIDPAVALDGAEQMLTSTSPFDALELLRMVPRDLEEERADAVRLGVVLASGRFLDAWRAADLMVPERQKAPGDGPSSVELLGQSWLGNNVPIIHEADSGNRMPPGLEWLWTQEVQGALARTGRVSEALSEGRELVHLLEQSGLPPFLVRRARLGLFDQECVTGEWIWASEALSGDWNEVAGPPGQGRTGSLYTAIADVLMGRFERANETLSREMPQLRVLGRHELLPLGYSLNALCLARLGEVAGARNAIAKADIPARGQGLSSISWAAIIFGAQALATLGRGDQALEQLLKSADQDRELGNASQELMSLSLAVPLDESLLPRLEEVAGRIEGRFAKACRCVTEGIRTHDLELIEEGAHLSSAVGQYFFTEFAEEKINAWGGTARGVTADAKAVSETDDRSSYQDVQVLVSQLTPRQHDIVEHIFARRSNAEIATLLGLSVRTVESHLYQVYAKLNVTSRKELKTVLSLSAPFDEGLSDPPGTPAEKPHGLKETFVQVPFSSDEEKE